MRYSEPGHRGACARPPVAILPLCGPARLAWVVKATKHFSRKMREEQTKTKKQKTK
jgi:hypothetical protein